MEYAIIAIAAFFVSILTLFSGFGLGTLLLPVFALFLPVDAAVAATAVVHTANNFMKAAVVGRKADFELVLKFGGPAVIAAFGGAALLGLVSAMRPLLAYSLAGRELTITPLKLLIGLLMLVFAFFELLPSLRNLRFGRKYLYVGGVLSGFFGGLSGHQGALRSAFLVKAGVSTDAFVGTNALIGLFVDIARLAIYGALAVGGGFAQLNGGRERMMLLAGISAAFLGVLAGKRLARKVTMSKVQTLVGIMLIGIAIAIGSGLI